MQTAATLAYSLVVPLNLTLIGCKRELEQARNERGSNPEVQNSAHTSLSPRECGVRSARNPVLQPAVFGHFLECNVCVPSLGRLGVCPCSLSTGVSLPTDSFPFVFLRLWSFNICQSSSVGADTPNMPGNKSSAPSENGRLEVECVRTGRRRFSRRLARQQDPRAGRQVKSNSLTK